MPKSHKISTELLGKAMSDLKGNYQKVADHFEVSNAYVRTRVSTDPKLRAVWIKNGTADPLPDAIEVLVREEDPEAKDFANQFYDDYH